MAGNYDLLGDPIPANHGGRGRPAHIPTEQNRNKVRLLLAFGWAKVRIAAALRITKGTLNTHYSADLKYREEASHALEANHKMMVYEAATKGNVGAMKELGKMIERELLARGGSTSSDDPKPRAPKLGKKEQGDADATTAQEGTGWAEVLTRH